MSDSGSQPRAVQSVDQGNGGDDDTAAQLRAIQRVIVGDERPDHRYIQKTSNRQKMLAICKARGIKMDTFDIGDTPPYDIWMRNFDMTSACAGMYAADLRVQYFTKIKDRLTEPNIMMEQMIADSEWWYLKFADVLYTLSTGEQPAKRVLH